MQNRSPLLSVDWVVVAIYLILLVCGWFSICGATHELGDTNFFDWDTRTGKQLVWIGLALILACNMVGCLMVALLARCSPMPLQETAQGIMEGRLAAGPLRCGLLAIGCGFIMTTTITFARQGKYLPLLVGVPLFINCGFPHCVADSFYCLCTPVEFLTARAGEILPFFLCIMLGNFVGCNLYRWTQWPLPKE